MTRSLVFLLCFLSGACALVYQVLWVRQLGLVFGVTTYAVATVLAAFMGGMALGSFTCGRLALWTRRPLALFALLEAGIGVSALVLPYGFAALGDGYAGLYERFAGSPALFDAVRFALAGALLAVPCFFMGGTVAVLAKRQSRSRESLGHDVGFLYGLNTLGAVAGALLAGFVLIAAFGNAATNLAAAATNLLIFATALLAEHFSPSRPPEAAADEEPGTARGASALPRRTLEQLAVAVFAVSGFCALGYEVLWTRTLVFYLHNSTYAFTAMLACFLLGIGLGSLLPAGRVDRSRRPAFLLGLSQVLIGGLTLAAILGYASLPRVLSAVQSLTQIDAWWKALVVQAVQAGTVLLPATFFMGLTFPAAVRLASGSPATVSREVGTLCAANTVGAIAGSLLVGFLLLPRLGLVGSFRVLIALNLFMGALVLVVSLDASRIRSPRLAVLLLPVLALLVPGDAFERAFRQGAEILFYRDDATDTVMVKARDATAPQRALYFSDGRGTAGTMTNPENRVYGHLPLLLHDGAREVLTIGFGVGNTLAAMVSHPELERIAVAELSRNVIAAAPYFPTNDRAWEDPRVEVHIQDGRNFLLGSSERWDVIQLEPPEIHTDGVVYLYTREFYELARRRLKPGGLVCQWANVRMMPLAEQKMLLGTFLKVFPHGTVWMPKLMTGFVLFIGGEEELRIDYRELVRRFAVPEVSGDLLENAGINHPLELLASFKLSSAGARTWTAGAAVITDERTRVDFTTPRSVDSNYGLTNAFSGLVVATFLPGGWPPTRDYQVAKLREIGRTVESVAPYLQNVGSPEETARVEEYLDAMGRRFQRVMAERVEAMAATEEPFVGM